MAHSEQRQLPHRFTVVDQQPTAHRQLQRAAVDLERPLVQRASEVEVEAAVPKEVCGLDGNAMAFQVARRRNDDAAAAPEQPGAEARVRQRTHSDRDIDALALQVDLRVREGQIDRDVRGRRCANSGNSGTTQCVPNGTDTFTRRLPFGAARSSATRRSASSMSSRMRCNCHRSRALPRSSRGAASERWTSCTPRRSSMREMSLLTAEGVRSSTLPAAEKSCPFPRPSRTPPFRRCDCPLP